MFKQRQRHLEDSSELNLPDFALVALLGDKKSFSCTFGGHTNPPVGLFTDKTLPGVQF